MGKSTPQTRSKGLDLLKYIFLLITAAVAISSRLFSVVRFESIIHEFDPWFNFRATKVITNEGFYSFWNWFDERSWYPLGRVVGGTLYPGLMITSAVIKKAFDLVNLDIDIKEICVFFAPAFSALTAVFTYLLTKEIASEAAGMLAAAFIAIAPGYISRSVAGSYDNEAIAITLLVLTFYLWIKASKQGSSFWGALTGLSYFYMVAAWGGYVFITNMIPLHIFVLLLMGRYSPKLYVSYCSFYVIGTISSMQIPFVGFSPIKTSEHMAALGVFGLLQLVAFGDFLKAQKISNQGWTMVKRIIVATVIAAVALLFILTSKSFIAPWTGRFYSLWDTGYAKIHIPIIASVSEHQPPTWASVFLDIHMLAWLLPAGLYICFLHLNNEHVFFILYTIFASYFSGVMVRLLLTLTPCACIIGGVAVSSLLETMLRVKARRPTEGQSDSDHGKSREQGGKRSTGKSVRFAANNTIVRTATSLVYLLYLVTFVYHCTWMTSSSYSSPSVILASSDSMGNQVIIDDFREAYYWLRQNTPYDAKVMSWWDYGYQIAGMADRITLVDNNTWNNTHIAMVGKAFASPEDKAYEIAQKHDVDYVLVVFGGLLGFSGDDINKFLWMIRIAQGVWPDEVKEGDFYSSSGEYRIDRLASKTMRDSLMYKLSYYRFQEIFGGQGANDRARNQVVETSPELHYFEEAFTTQNWLVRVYKVKPADSLGRNLESATKFESRKRVHRGKQPQVKYFPKKITANTPNL